MKLFRYQCNWSPYSNAVRAKNRKDAMRLIRLAYRGYKGNFFRLFP